MSLDPFAPEPLYGPGLPGETPQDPFAPPSPLLVRTPRTATGNVSPTISIQVEDTGKERIRGIETFMLCDDVQQLADPWSCSVPNVDGEHDYLLDCLWFKVTLYVSDPRVQDGREIEWLRGVITSLGQTAAEGSGTTIRLAGYDRGWYLGSGVVIHKGIKGASVAELFRRFVRPEYNWGITSGVSIYMANRQRQGRLDAEIAQAKKQLKENEQAQLVALVQEQAAAISAGRPVPTRAAANLDMTPPWFTKVVIQTEPGEDVGSLLIRHARVNKRLCGMAADGTFQYFQPDYKQAVSYVFHNHRPKDARRTRNNVEPGWDFDRSGDQLHNVVECVTTSLIKDGTDLANQANPNEGKNVGSYVDFRTAGPGAIDWRTSTTALTGPEDARSIDQAPLRRTAFNEGERWNLAQAKERALWKWQQELYASLTLTYPVQGISQMGPDGQWRLYCAGTMAEVYDSWNHVERKMFVSRVQFNRSGQGTMSTITLKLPDLLGA